MANIFVFLSKDGNITPKKARKSRQMQFRDKTAYVWGLRYRWDSSLSRNPVPRFPHFMPPWRRAMQSPLDPQLLAPAGQEEHFEGRFNVKMIKKIFDRSKTVPNTEWCLESWSARRIAGSRSEWIAEGLAFKERVFCLFFWRRFVSKII